MWYGIEYSPESTPKSNPVSASNFRDQNTVRTCQAGRKPDECETNVLADPGQKVNLQKKINVSYVKSFESENHSRKC